MAGSTVRSSGFLIRSQKEASLWIDLFEASGRYDQISVHFVKSLDHARNLDSLQVAIRHEFPSVVISAVQLFSPRSQDGSR